MCSISILLLYIIHSKIDLILRIQLVLMFYAHDIFTVS